MDPARARPLDDGVRGSVMEWRRRRLMATLLLFAVGGCTTGPATIEEGTRQLSRYSVAHQGPELEESTPDIPFELAPER